MCFARRDYSKNRLPCLHDHAEMPKRGAVADSYVAKNEDGLNGSLHHLRPSYPCVTSVRAR